MLQRMEDGIRRLLWGRTVEESLRLSIAEAVAREARVRGLPDLDASTSAAVLSERIEVRRGDCTQAVARRFHNSLRDMTASGRHDAMVHMFGSDASRAAAVLYGMGAS